MSHLCRSSLALVLLNRLDLGLCTGYNATLSCLYLGVNKELLYSFDDTLGIFFYWTDCSGEIDRKKEKQVHKIIMRVWCISEVFHS